MTSFGSKIMSDSQRTDFPAFTEHRVQRDRGSLYVRDFPGSGAAFVLLHGFPDNSHIYDDLIPHLAFLKDAPESALCEWLVSKRVSRTGEGDNDPGVIEPMPAIAP